MNSSECQVYLGIWGRGRGGDGRMCQVRKLLPQIIHPRQNPALVHTLQISYAQGREFAEKVNAIFFETSALKATNIEEIFLEVGE